MNSYFLFHFISINKKLHAIPMIHGTSETALHEICQTGSFSLATNIILN